MTTFGTNMKISVAKEHRALVRKIFAEVLGCTIKTPKEDLDQFLFADGFSLGAFFVEPAEALKPIDHIKAPWLELVVEDLAETRRLLGALGVEPFNYYDKSHDYYCPPCGPVFRLAPKNALRDPRPAKK
jgi:hypothetical protein